MNCVILNVNDPLQWEIVHGVSKQIDFEFVYVLHGPNLDQIDAEYQALLSDLGDRVELHSASDFVGINTIRKLPQPELGADILNFFDNLRPMFYKICERSGVFGITEARKEEVFQRLLAHFLILQKVHTFDFVIAWDTPHSFFAYLLYMILVKSGVQVVRLEHHFLQDKLVLLDHGPIPDLPMSFFANHTLAELKRSLSPGLRRQIDAKNTYLQTAHMRESKFAAGKSAGRKLRTFSHFTKVYMRNFLRGIMPFLFRKHGHGIASLNDPVSDFTFWTKTNKILRRQYSLLNKYLSFTSIPDLTANYVFFGLHMQPEKTSLPLGGHFSDQREAIKLLAASIPKDWFVYIKEHPNQYNPKITANARFRSLMFYQDLINLPQVRFVPQDVSSHDLIGKARLVSTLTGTVGWEALLRGVPVIAFGQAYYSACMACRSPKNVVQCQKSVIELTAMNREDVLRELYRYLLYIEQENYLVHGFISKREQSWNKVPIEVQKQTLISAIATKIQKGVI